ncbi:H-NS family nucleoid-associated regulatory protein [Shimwellia blattae]|uniref:DNA-binding protein n=1 Tax=Shimwellia blattae (strain ATCC 29907 / DSM 4481 / JCM 1650 / NBRC 105725 / CDC 9005-74) TaxID=630626 RepID=I2B682_SHIBC|nr:H-NS family nucleoid-associated regulatory protein [Shimwellia blattae]AFJ46036.1 DNA-binding protein [Shimwellia blattae DSM 4481 = NBRC 105725]GAB82686.1 DNA-binding protein StpA [Shimwellia blattae DSM 4481 = NBRC 105725]VDY63509.1 H-NS homolog stpA [Shimwellia blattae]VEC21475.1 H-NS homolog stpA [Shimwellia blattae]
MSQALQALNNIRTLRAHSRDFSIDVLAEMLEKLRIVTEEKRQEQLAAQQARREHEEKLSTWLELMESDGISPRDLIVSADEKAPKKNKPRAPKYRYQDASGEEKTWTGQGRMPKPIAQAVAAGKSLDDFLL